MTIALSTALMQYAWNVGSVAEAMTGGCLRVYSGLQPLAPEYAPTGTLLATITDSGGAYTAETSAVGSIEFSGTGSTTVSSITVDGIELLSASVVEDGAALVAQAVWNAINDASHRHDFLAAWDSNVTVTLTCRPGRGTKFNSATVTGSLSGGVSASYTNMAGGVASVNGLRIGRNTEVLVNASSQLVAMLYSITSDVWSGLGVAEGTAGWWRFSGAFGDDFAADTDGTRFRIDGSIDTTSGAGVNMVMADAAISVSEAVEVGLFGLSSSINNYTP